MASSYGIIHQYGEPQSTFDTQLAVQALGQKQQNYDANAMKIEQTLAQVGLSASQIKNDSAIEYLFSKVNAMANNITQLTGGDLGKNSVTGSIISEIRGVTQDPNVIKHIGYGQAIDNYQRSVQQHIKEDDGKYSDLNYRHGLETAGYQQYINGDVSAELGSLNYTPYSDYQTEVLDKAKKIKDLRSDQIVEVADGKGGIVRTEIKNMTSAQWLKYMPSLMTDANKKQMQIEGASRFGWNNQAAKEARNTSRDIVVSGYQDKINKIDLKLNNTSLTRAQKDKLQADKKTYQQQITRTQTSYNEMGNSAAAIGGYQVEQEFLRNTSEMIGTDPSRLIEKDQAYFARQNETDALNPMSGQGNARYSDLTVANLQDISVADYEDRQYNASEGYKNDVTSGYNTMPQDLKTKVDELVPEMMKEGVSELEARGEAMELVYKNSNEEGGLQEAEKLSQARRKRDRYNATVGTAYNKINNETLWSGEKADDTFEAMMENNRTQVNYGGRNLGAQDYLKTVQYQVNGQTKTGVNSKEEFREFIKTDQGKDLKGQIYAGMLASETVVDGLGYSNNIGTALTTGENMPRISKELYHNFKRLSKLYGEDLNFTDVFKVSISNTPNILSGEYMPANLLDSAISFVTGKKVEEEREVMTEEYLQEHLGDIFESSYVELNEDFKSTKTYQAIANRVGGGNFSKLPTSFLGERRLAVGFGADVAYDNTFYDDNAIRNNLSYDSYKKELKEEMDTAGMGVVTPKKATFNVPATPGKTTPEFEDIQVLVSNSDNTQGFSTKAGSNPIEIYVDPTDPDKYVVSQLPIETKVYEFGDGRNTATIDKSQMIQLAPNIYNQIKSEQVAGELEFDEDFETNNITYEESTPRRLQNMLGFIGDPNLVEASTLQGAKDILKRDVPNIYSSESPYKVAFDYALENPDKFKTKFTRRGSNTYIDILVDTGEGYEKLQQVDVSGKDRTIIDRTINTFPQAFLTLALKNAAIEIDSRGELTDNVRPLIDLYNSQN